jgi:3-hydroxyisobutyrate dehydrogenase-like beta-hydroxyacid dehydrogenase
VRLAFLCLGVMGYPMAGHLARAGHAVCVYNRTRARAEAFVAEHAGADVTLAAEPAAAAEGAEVVLACTGADDDLRAITRGADGAAGAFDGMASGTLFVDHTTASPSLARELAAEAGRSGIGWLDAPVSGGQAGAEAGRLTVMVGGAPDDYARAAPLLDCYAQKRGLMGPAGSGQLTKMVNQVCIAGLVQALAEGLHFARRSGLDAERVVEVISHGAAQSWQMDNRAGTMLADRFDFGFAVDWMRKDLGIALGEARRIGARLPVTALVDQLYGELQARGAGRLDTSSLIRLLEGADRAREDPEPD